MLIRIFVGLLLLLVSCQKTVIPPVDYIAKVGDSYILTDEFIRSFEFSMLNKRTLENPLEDHLEFMIAELLLANQAYSMELDTLSSIRYAVEGITEERIIEEVFTTEVLDQIQISEDEIEAELEKSAVQFQLQYLPLTGKKEAEGLKQDAEIQGLENIIAEYSNEMMGEDGSTTDYLSPYLDYTSTDPVLLNQILEFPVGTVQGPIEYNGQWILLEVVDIKRSPIAPEDFDSKSESIRKVLYNKKAMEQAEQFVTGLMEPKQLSTRREPFNVLNKAFFEWYGDAIPTYDLLSQVKNGAKEYHEEIRQILSDVLITTVDDRWTVAQFLEEFTPARYPLRDDNFAEFTNQFADVIALVYRDHVLLALAEKNKLADKSEVKRDIELWEQKWLYQHLRSTTYNAPNAKETVPFEQRKNTLWESIDSLKLVYPVDINTQRLDEVSSSIDITNTTQIQLFKQNSNRMAFPMVDPIWKKKQ
jgi:hypothetical protein